MKRLLLISLICFFLGWGVMINYRDIFILRLAGATIYLFSIIPWPCYFKGNPKLGG